MDEIKVALRLCGFQKISDLSSSNIINNINEK